MNLESIHICACIWGRKIHVCNSEYRMGKVVCNLGGRVVVRRRQQNMLGIPF